MTSIALWAAASYQDIVARHKMAMAKYPNAEVGRARPYSGIDNLRPESRKIVDAFISWSNKK